MGSLAETYGSERAVRIISSLAVNVMRETAEKSGVLRPAITGGPSSGLVSYGQIRREALCPSTMRVTKPIGTTAPTTSMCPPAKLGRRPA